MHATRTALARWLMNRVVPAVFPRVNPLILRVLQSPLHPLLSWYVAVVRFEGKRTGRSYDVPFAYHRVDERTVECLTNRRSIWWRNLRGGTQSSLLFKGRWMPAHAESSVDFTAVVGAMHRRDWPRRLIMNVPPTDGVVVSVTVDV
ncbi:MAG: hypothetical protein O2826_09230 [Chloroflexi bacterium]|nr:hypothetical protein [Chloroflexota bacterium]MDA1174685.1 hypothetical protein [Chloroflexota bacterium]